MLIAKGSGRAVWSWRLPDEIPEYYTVAGIYTLVSLLRGPRAVGSHLGVLTDLPRFSHADAGYAQIVFCITGNGECSPGSRHSASNERYCLRSYHSSLFGGSSLGCQTDRLCPETYRGISKLLHLASVFFGSACISF